MINLLPQSRQKKLQHAEFFKVVAIIGMVTGVVFLVFILMLMQIRFFYSNKFQSAKIVLAEKEREMEIFGVKKNENEIIRDNNLISKMSNFYAHQTKITGIFLQVAQELPSGLSLSRFSYISNKINLEGQASDRDSLVAFKNNLEHNPNFSNAVFPSTNWLSAKNINFSVNFEYVKQ